MQNKQNYKTKSHFSSTKHIFLSNMSLIHSYNYTKVSDLGRDGLKAQQAHSPGRCPGLCACWAFSPFGIKSETLAITPILYKGEKSDA